MSVTSINFVLSQFESERYRYFVIYDDDGDVVYTQNELIDQESAINKLKLFIKSHEGYYTIKVISKKLINLKNVAQIDQNLITKFNIEIYATQLSTTSSNVSNTLGSILPSDDPRNNAPNIYELVSKLEGMNTQMKLQEKDHTHYRENQALRDENKFLKEESEKNKGMNGVVSTLGEHFKDPSVLMGLISGLGTMFKKEQVMPMNGINEQVVNNLSTRKNKMTSAVNVLMELDENFPENISNLAILCKNKPQIYKMAVGYLNNL